MTGATAATLTLATLPTTSSTALTTGPPGLPESRLVAAPVGVVIVGFSSQIVNASPGS